MIIRNKWAAILFLLIISLQPILPEEPLNSWQKVREQLLDQSRKVKVFIDNTNIQSYRQKIGLWKQIPYGTDIAALVGPFGISEDEFLEINDLPLNTKKIFNPQWLFIPYSEKYLRELEQNGFSRITWESAGDEFIWPVEGVRITSRLGQRWGKFHPGLDIAASSGTLVLAAMDGEVTESRYLGDYGKTVMLGHNQMYVSLYAHLSEIFVKKGDKIKKGQVIGLSGTSGRSTGPHLHFEVRYLNVVLNPEVFMPAFKESIYALIEKEETTAESP